VCGGFAGTAAKLVVYPLDMLKKRLQVRALACGAHAYERQVIGFEHARTGFGTVPKYTGLTHCIRLTLEQEGVAGACTGGAHILSQACSRDSRLHCSKRPSCRVSVF
jgi:hypothetical protein